VTSITELDDTFAGIPPLSDLALATQRPSTGATITSVGDMIEITIPPAVSDSYIHVFDQAFATFSFNVPGDGTNIRATSTQWVTNQGDVAGTSSVFLSPIPEPASICLLGIGVASLFVVRRLLKPVRREVEPAERSIDAG
jgi:hypothetical protein